jgi:hypothetical protein
MWKALKRVLWLLLGLLIAIVGVGALLPDRAHVERSVTVGTPPTRAFEVLNSFRDFSKWSPWHERDPNARYRFDGPESGVGARMSWESSNPQVGKGSQTIAVSEPERRIKVLLDFGPMGQAAAGYLIAPDGAGSRITWTFDTEFGWDLFGRYLGLMMDRWIGPDYERGLANLKKLLERPGPAQAPAAAPQPAADP